jgi:tetratricopeptide (TPR) repeat protein
MKLNDIEKAEENYREAVTIDNLFFPAKNNLAMIYYRQGKTDQAIVLFKDMISNNPGETEGYYYLALVYGELKRYDEAIALLETASGKNGAHARIFYNLGLLYQMTGQLGKSESTLARGLAMEPQNYDLLYALCTFYLQQKQNVKAAVYAQRIADLFPQNPMGKQLLQASSAR